MAYTDRFVSTDLLILNLKPLITQIRDPQILANFAGFLCVSAVTVYELAIKDIFCDFAEKKNKVFGTFTKHHFSRINGRIKIDAITDDYAKTFGDKYKKNFKNFLAKKEESIMQTDRISIKSRYNNLILNRHSFVHNGALTFSINEAMDSYISGKEVIHILNKAMKR